MNALSRIPLLASGWVLLLFAAQAQASLADRGDGTVFDSDRNLLWTQDANLFKTQAAGNPNLVLDVIAAVGGEITDSAGSYALSGVDFDVSTGTVSWYGAQAWIGYLNSIAFGGHQDWRLPATVSVTGTTAFDVAFSYDGSTDVAYNNTTGELGHLFYTELGNHGFYTTAGAEQSPYGVTQTGPFSNLTSATYWSDTELDEGNAWYFSALDGKQDYFDKTAHYLAVGVAPVPVPAAVWLFGSTFGAWAVIARSRARAKPA